MKTDNPTIDLDKVLEGRFAFPMSARGRAITDQHVQHAIAVESARRRSPSRRSFLTRARGLLVGAAAAALVVGTVAASGTLFDTLIQGAPTLESAWANAEEIGKSTSDSGVTIVLERAGVVQERLWVALTVADETNSATDIGSMKVTDANGVVMAGGTGAGTGDVAGTSASLFGFHIPDGISPEGPFRLEVSSVTTQAGVTDGDWTFTFDMLPAERR